MGVAVTRSDAVERLLAELRLVDGPVGRAALADRWRPQADPALIVRLAERLPTVLRDEPQLGLVAAELALELADGLDERAVGLALRARAHARRTLGDNRGALEDYDAALERFVRAGDQHQAARTQIGRIEALTQLGRHDEALAAAEAARALFLALGDELRAAHVDLNAANVYFRRDEHERALQLQERAHAAYERLGEHEMAALTDINRANALVHLGRFREAEALYAAARAYCQARGLGHTGAIVEYNLAYLYLLREEYSRALALFERCEATFAAVPDPRHVALCQLDRAEALLQLRSPREAAALAETARAGLERLGLGYEAAKAAAFRATALALLRDWPAALEELDRARAAFARQGNAVWVAALDLQAALARLAQGSAAEALRLAEGAAAVFSARGLPARLAQARLVAAGALAALGRRRRAAGQARAALRALRGLSGGSLAARAHALLGRLAAERGSVPAARRHLERAARLVERVRPAVWSEDLRLSFFAEHLDVYEALFLLYARSGDPADARRAFEVAERARARALADLLGSAAAPPVADARARQLADRLEGLRRELSACLHDLDRRELEAERLGAPSALRGEARRLEAAIEQTWRELGRRDAEYVALQAVRTTTVEALQADLPADATLVAYFSAGGRLHALTVTARSVASHPDLASVAEVGALVSRFRAQLGRFSFGPAYVAQHRAHLEAAARAPLAALYGALLAPLRGRLATERLIVVPSGPLYYVPFCALVTPEGYLGDRFELALAPSGTALRFALRRPPQVGPPLVLAPEDPTIPHAAAEAAAVARLLPGATLRRGAAASRATLAAEGPGRQVIHLATHGVFRADAPRFSAVKLADGWLDLLDVYRLRIPSGLVVLSACETGTGQVAAGDEVVGLVRGFLYAGAASLVVSLWAVPDESTALLMSELYARLARGATIGAALRGAQAAVRARYPHPYYWAPFVLIGRDEPLPLEVGA